MDKTIDGVEFCTWLLITTKEKQQFCPKISGDVLEAILVAIMRIQCDIIKSGFLLNDKQITQIEAFKTSKGSTVGRTEKNSTQINMIT